MTPSYRFLYFGEERWLGRFLDLARETGDAIRANYPEVEDLVKGAAWEGPQFIAPNLWSYLLPKT